jgi:3-methylcrotonyl-CoA carboxylase beta subunit
VIVRNQGTIFLGGPPLVKAATGEVVSAEDLGGADVHTRQSGVADHYARTTSMRCDRAADRRRNLNRRKQVGLDTGADADSSRLRRGRDSTASCRGRARKPYDVREIIARIVDGSELDEFKPLTARRWSPALRIFTACRSASSPTTACCSPKAR